MRVIIHLDLDCFYAQVEHERLGISQNEPLAVQQWGSLLAVNYAARPFGVNRSDHIGDARKKCPQIHLPHVETMGERSIPVPGADLTKNPYFNRKRQKAILRRYRLASREVFRILAKYAPSYEKASIDEAFLDVTQIALARLEQYKNSKSDVAFCQENTDTKVIGVEGSIFPFTQDEELLSIGAKIAQEIRKDVYETLHFTCSVGIATNKLLAKLASPINKPNGQTIIPHRSVAYFMQTFRVDKIRGLGGKLGQRVVELGKRCNPEAEHVFAGDLLNEYGLAGLQQHLGQETGSYVYNLCSGDDGNEPVNDKKVVVQQVSAIKSFNQVGPLKLKDDVGYWIRILCEEVVLRHDEEEVVEHNRTPSQFAINYSGLDGKPMQKRFPAPSKIDIPTLYNTIMPLLEHTDMLPCMHLSLVARDFIPLVQPKAMITHFFKEKSSILDKQKECSIIDVLDANEDEEKPPISSNKPTSTKQSFATSKATKKSSIAQFFKEPAKPKDYDKYCEICKAILMLPYCSSDAPDVWLCLRGLTLGTISLWTTIICFYLVSIMLPLSITVAHLRSNVIMVLFTGVEMFLLLLRCLWLDEPKLMIGAKYCRAMQVAISCWLYGIMACEIMSKRSWINGLLAPVLAGVAILMTIDVVVLIKSVEVDCHHSSWLVMSVATATLAVSFSLLGSVVLKEFKSIRTLQRQIRKVLPNPAEVEQSYHQLWLLVMANMISSVLQLVFDLYITYLASDQSCSRLFYDDNDGAFEQMIRFGFSLGSFVYPEWITLYVFYWIPRHQFSTKLDVPELDIISDDENYHLYQPLVNSPQTQTIMSIEGKFAKGNSQQSI
ncbi:hypothetical protein THRCLA_08831 [Thraustotheca clavata]|uniref:UmuC domain-containing protein n=1 Tax=Thraustotheca clavata TaxID=74557 RepID=A0A1V9Z1T5_9STRA|nr:hypothetical protein THRCLA_08831 [Thraustotheca clavata]